MFNRWMDKTNMLLTNNGILYMHKKDKSITFLGKWMNLSLRQAKWTRLKILNFSFICTILRPAPNIYNMGVERELERAIQYRWHENRRRDYGQKKEGAQQEKSLGDQGGQQRRGTNKNKVQDTHTWQCHNNIHVGRYHNDTHAWQCSQWRGAEWHAPWISAPGRQRQGDLQIFKLVSNSRSVNQDYIVRHCLKIKNKINKIKKRENAIIKDIIVHDMLIWNFNSKIKTKFQYLETSIDRRSAMNIWMLLMISNGEIIGGLRLYFWWLLYFRLLWKWCHLIMGHAYVACSVFCPYQEGPSVEYE